jgi:hypothetical protein
MTVQQITILRLIVYHFFRGGRTERRGWEGEVGGGTAALQSNCIAWVEGNGGMRQRTERTNADYTAY